MTWFPLPPGTDVGDLPVAPTPTADGTYGLIITTTDVIPPYIETIQYRAYASRGEISVGAEDAATRQTQRRVVVAARGTYAVTGLAAAVLKGQRLSVTAAKGTRILTGRAAATVKGFAITAETGTLGATGNGI